MRILSIYANIKYLWGLWFWVYAKIYAFMGFAVLDLCGVDVRGSGIALRACGGCRVHCVFK